MIFAGTVTGIFVTASLLLSCCLAADWAAEESARTLPPYAREDISALLAKDVWSEEDYAYLYKQTGLGKAPLDELKSTPERILEFQDALFFQPQIAHIDAAITTPHDYMDGKVSFPIAPLHDGDVIISSSCHTFGWRNGHAALIVYAKRGITFESFTPTTPSGYGTVEWFSTCSNFMVLRLKEEYRAQTDPAEIAKSAQEKLMHVPYRLTVGIFFPKDQCKNGRTPTATHCAHIVWQAFYNFGLDIDSNGGAVVVPRDIARSKYFEVVQMSGFDPDKLW